MCVAIPGEVIELEDETAIIDFSGNRVKVRTGLVDVKVGDYALVHAGCVIQVMQDQDALDLIDLLQEVENY